MIIEANNIAGKHDIDTFHETMEQEINGRLFELRQKLKETNQLLDDIEHFKNSGVAKLYMDGLNAEYQKFFKNATETDDANIAKANLDKMKGVGYAMGLISKTINGIEDDVEAIELEIQHLEAGQIL